MNAKPHKHAALIKQWADAPEWWDVYCKKESDFFLTTTPSWRTHHEYELHKSANHPDNIKPKKRLIQWGKMPRGTMTTYGEFRGVSFTRASIEREDNVACRYMMYASISELRLKEQTQFTYWGGGECPVPEGVLVEVVLRRGEKEKHIASSLWWKHENPVDEAEIIAYRITGLADGWTDNPEESV